MRPKYFSSTFILTIFLTAYGSSALATTFKIATLSPDGSYWMQQLRAGAEEVELKTNKRVKFKFYPGGVMGDDNSVLRKMRVGQLNGAALTNGSLNIFYPDIQLYNLVMKFNSLDEVDYIRSKMDVQLQEGLEANGIIPLGFAEIGFAYLMSLQPIHNIDDFRSRKAWVPEGNYIAESALSALSVSPIPLPIRDVFVGLQTGMVDVVAGSPVGAIALQWHTQVKYILDLPLSYIFGVLAINQNDFNKLAIEDQMIVRDTMGARISQIDKQNRLDNISALRAINNQGVEMIAMKPSQIEDLRALVTTANQKLITTGKINPESVTSMENHLRDLKHSK